MTSSGLEWDYYEFQPVESSSVEYATSGANSFLLPANTDKSYWDPSAISEWSMSIHTAHTSEIVKEKVVPVKELKDEKDKRNQKRKARKEPRRSEREKEVRNLVHQPCLELDVSHGCMLRSVGAWPSSAAVHGCMVGMAGSALAALRRVSCPVCALSQSDGENKLISNEGPRPRNFSSGSSGLRSRKINFKWYNYLGFLIISSWMYNKYAKWLILTLPFQSHLSCNLFPSCLFFHAFLTSAGHASSFMELFLLYITVTAFL